MEQLIRDLNSPRNQGQPAVIHQIQRDIQQLQRQPEAWQTGLNLLNSSDHVLQFYGALTINLKVSADWEADSIGQDRDHVARLLQELVGSFVKLALSSGTDLVLTKLCSTLAAIFAKSDTAWAHPCRHVLTCVLARKYVSERDCPSIQAILASNASISAFALKFVLRLSLALREEWDSPSHKENSHRYQLQLRNTADDAFSMIYFALVICDRQALSGSKSLLLNINLQVQPAQQELSEVGKEAVSQVPFWTKHVFSDQDAPAQKSQDLFASVTGMAIDLLESPPMTESCITSLTGLLNDSIRIVKRAIPGYLDRINRSQAASRLIHELTSGNFSAEGIAFVSLYAAVIEQQELDTPAYLKDESIQVLLQRSLMLLKCPGAAGVEDEVCQTVLETMTSIVEGAKEFPDDELGKHLIDEVCQAVLAKVQYPQEQLDKRTATWDEEDYTRFEDFRFEASDFLQAAYSVLGSRMSQIVEHSVSAQSHLSWPVFEAALFVLTSIQDAAQSEEEDDPYMARILSLSPWSQGMSAPDTIPARVRHAMIKFLGEITDFLERNPSILLDCLRFLFGSLQTKTHANYASRAIYRLCDKQRSFLAPQLPDFLQAISTLQNIPLHSRCKVLSGVAALVQALPSEADRVEPLQRILQLLQDLELGQANSAGDEDDISSPAFERLSMLAALAKGLQAPDDIPIDLEAEEDPLNSVDFWTIGSGKPIQEAALRMLAEPWSRLLQPDGTDLVTAACDFLKAGFKEQHPSPLKYAPNVSVNLICSLIDLKNENLDQTMNTTSCYISSIKMSPSTAFEAETIINQVVAITKQCINLLNDQNTNPSFSAPTSILDFFIRSLPKLGLHILLHPSGLEIMNTMFDYAILLLRSTVDTLPRRSAASFFASFLDFTTPDHKLSSNPTSAQVIIALLDKYSPVILGLTLHLIAGECARSELESLSELLRKFVTRQQLRAKRVLVEAMKPESAVLLPKAIEATKPEQRARFVSQVEMLRGGRKTNEVVRDFWVTCRGGRFGYIT